MTEKAIREMLNKLSEYPGQAGAIESRRSELLYDIEQEKQARIEAELPSEYRAKLAEIEREAKAATESVVVEFDPQIASVGIAIDNLQDVIKTEIIKYGQSVKGDHLQGVFVKGRVSWNDKGLEGFALEHPELMKLREVKDPTAQIRKVG